MRYHRRRRWRQRYDAYAHTGRVDIPTSAWRTSISGNGRYTPGNSQRPPTEGAMDVPGILSTAHVAHGGDPPGVCMDDLIPDSKGYHQHKIHQPVRDPVKFGGGTD